MISIKVKLVFETFSFKFLIYFSSFSKTDIDFDALGEKANEMQRLLKNFADFTGEKLLKSLILGQEILETYFKMYGKYHPNSSRLMSSISEILTGINGGDDKYKFAFGKETMKCIEVTYGRDHPFYRQVRERIQEIL